MASPAAPFRPPLQLSPPVPKLETLTSRHVAVIGAGPAGLVAARELGREGHRVVVFERGDQVGGTWVYTPKVESDPLGLDPRRAVVHSSLYDSLRTNLPREIMGFLDFPFVAREDDKERDSRRFPGHREVLEYLKEFAREFGVEEMVRFQTEVVHAGVVESNGGDVNKWEVRSKKRSGVKVAEIFDAVVVCNGHYSQPRIAQFPGIEIWPGKQIHSHNYRVPEPFRDQVVVLIGTSSSAGDISRDIAGIAKEVHVVFRSIADEKLGKHPVHDNMWLHPMVMVVSNSHDQRFGWLSRAIKMLIMFKTKMQIKSVHRDGSVVFMDESVVFADVILHCTGYALYFLAGDRERVWIGVHRYKYHFPFLETNGIVTEDDDRVGPLYKHVFPPAFAPCLSFVGLPMKVIPFTVCELQSKWIAGTLSDRILLPSKENMMEDINNFYSMLEVSGTPKRHTHNMSNDPFEYGDWLAVQCGCPSYEEWRKQVFYAVARVKKAQPEKFRDVWDYHDLISQAHHDFAKYLPNKNKYGDKKLISW